MIQTSGWACAAVGPSSHAPTSSRLIRQYLAVAISGGLRRVQEAPPPQERVRLRVTAAEGDIGSFRIARAARRIDIVVKAFGDSGIENVAGLLEGAERVGIHHFRPHVAVIARGVMVAGEDVG